MTFKRVDARELEAVVFIEDNRDLHCMAELSLQLSENTPLTEEQIEAILLFRDCYPADIRDFLRDQHTENTWFENVYSQLGQGIPLTKVQTESLRCNIEQAA